MKSCSCVVTSIERTEHRKIFVSRNGHAMTTESDSSKHSADLAEQIEAVARAARAGDRNLILKCLKQIVPEYETLESGMYGHTVGA